MRKKYFFVALFAMLALLSSCNMKRDSKQVANDNYPQVRYNELPNMIEPKLWVGINTDNSIFSPLKHDKGMIPNAEIAAKLAYIYVSAVFGEERAKREQPYYVYTINENFWEVEGYLPKNHEGGVFHIILEKQTGRIISIGHGK